MPNYITTTTTIINTTTISVWPSHHYYQCDASLPSPKNNHLYPEKMEVWGGGGNNWLHMSQLCMWVWEHEAWEQGGSGVYLCDVVVRLGTCLNISHFVFLCQSFPLRRGHLSAVLKVTLICYQHHLQTRSWGILGEGGVMVTMWQEGGWGGGACCSRGEGCHGNHVARGGRVRGWGIMQQRGGLTWWPCGKREGGWGGGVYLFNILQPNFDMIKTFAHCEVIQHKYALRLERRAILNGAVVCV